MKKLFLITTIILVNSSLLNATVVNSPSTKKPKDTIVKNQKQTNEIKKEKTTKSKNQKQEGDYFFCRKCTCKKDAGKICKTEYKSKNLQTTTDCMKSKLEKIKNEECKIIIKDLIAKDKIKKQNNKKLS